MIEQYKTETREIRRVPQDWIHPTESVPGGELSIPLMDEDIEAGMARWLAERAEWEAGTHTDYDASLRDFAVYKPAPVAAQCRPYFDPATATAYQVYTVNVNGTGIPISEVLSTEEILVQYLLRSIG